MTRTETDLRDLLLARADRAPDPHAILARLAPAARPHRRRTLLLTGVVATAAVVAGTSAAAVWLGSGTASPQFLGGVASRSRATTPSALLTFTLDAARPASGFEVQSHTVTTTRETVVFARDRRSGQLAGETDSIDAVAYPKGGFDPAGVRTGTRVTINGKPGWFGPARGRVIGAGGEETQASTPSVAWQSAPDTWIVVNGVRPGDRTEAAELTVARSLRLARSAVRLPMKVGYLPTPLAAMSIAADALQPSATVEFAGGGRTLQIDVGAVDHQSLTAIFGPDGAPLRVAGHPAKVQDLSSDRLEGHLLTLVLDDRVVTIGGNLAVSTEELKAVAEHLTYSKDATHPPTWFAAREALP